MDIFIFTSSPGEISGWVSPLVKKLKKEKPESRIIVLIPPCPYASGKEVEVCKNIPEIDKVFGAKASLKFLFLGKLPFDIYPLSKGVILHLGGDLFYSVLLSKRLGWPAFAYTHKFVAWEKHFRKFMVIDEKVKTQLVSKGIAKEKIAVVGNLMLDGVEPQFSQEEDFKLWGLEATKPVLSLMPGSRPFQVKYMSPLFLKVAELVKEEIPKVQILFSKSAFVPPEYYIKMIEKRRQEEAFEGIKGNFQEEEGKLKIITEKGIEILFLEAPYDIMQVSDLVLTVPGTNTAEAAFLGISMVVVAPLNKPEVIPLYGFWGYVGRIPFIGRFLKKWVIKKFDKQVKFVAHPNKRKRKEIVPEIRGIVKAKEIAEKVVELLKNPSLREKMSEELHFIMGERGAAERIVALLFDEWNK